MKMLILTALVTVLLVTAAFVGRNVRRQVMARNALAAGNAAYEREEWQTAHIMLQRYLWVHPGDRSVLAKLAHAYLAVRPLPRENIAQATNAYRQLLSLNPGDELAFRRLALIYETTGNSGELAYIARKRLEVAPGDPAATVAEAKSLLYRKKLDEARTELESLVNRLAERGEESLEFVEACILLSRQAVQAIGPSGDSARETEALAWLTRAIEHSPDSAIALVRRAALPRELAQRARRELSVAERQETENDLGKAEKVATTDPRALLLLSEEWMARGALQRAQAQLDAARHLDPQVLQEFFVDPDDWLAAQFVQAAKLALVTGNVDDGTKLAQNALDQLKNRPQRVEFLPLAVKLFVAGKRIAEARASLDEYLDAMKQVQSRAGRDEQVPFLQAIVARAEGQPYRVIELLEPAADRPAAPQAIRVMLAEAYSRTGQAGRAAKVLATGAVAGGTTPETAKLLVRSYLQQGAWAEAQGVLGALAGLPSVDVDAKVLELATRLALAVEERTPAAEGKLDALADELAALRDAHAQRVDIRVLLATVAQRRGRTEAAVSELQRAREQCTDPLPAALALVRLYRNARRFDEARNVLQQECQQRGTQAAPWLALGDLLADQQKIDEARATLREALAAVAGPKEKRKVTIRLAVIDVTQGAAEAGVSALRELATGDPGDIEVRALMLDLPQVLQDRAAAQNLVDEIKNVEGNGGLLWRLHQARLWLAGAERRSRQKEAGNLLKYCIEADPGGTAAVLVLGGMYEQIGDRASAEAVYWSSFGVGAAPEIGDRLLALLQKQRRFSEARDVLERLRQRLDERALGARRVALALGEGLYDEALSELELRVAGAEKDPLDLVRLAGLCYRQKGEVDRALGYLDQAAALGADPTALARARVAIFKGEKRFAEAEAVLDELVRTKPTPEAYLLRASYHAGAERADLAEQDYVELARLAKNDRGHAVLGEFYAQTQRLDQAITTWQEGLRLYSESTVLKRGLSKALLLRGGPGDRKLAGKLLAELQASLPDDTDLLWVQAVEKVGAGTPEAANEARALLKTAVNSAPATAEVYRGLVALALALGEYGTARELALRGLHENPGDAGLLLSQARTELVLQNLDLARELARSVLKRDRQSFAAHEVLIEVALQQRDVTALRSGLEVVQQLIQNDANSEALQVMRARIYAGLDQKDDALAALEEFRATEAGRKSVPALLLIHDLYRMKGDFATARQRLDAAAVLAPDLPAVLHARVVLLADQKRFDEIVALMGEKPGSHPSVDLLLSAATRLAGSSAHLDAAISLCRRAVELSPHDARAHLALGDLTYKKGDVAAAEQAYRAVLRENPSLPEALNNLAWLLAERVSPSEEALAHARKAVALRPDDANFRNTLGFVLKRLQQLEGARTEFKRSADLAPPGSAVRAKSLLGLAQVCEQLDDRSPIEGYLKEALAAENGAPIFSPAERAEAERLLNASKNRK